ncbi:MAG: hypothetical protein SFZ24_01060 [Planctomycetota bacterium]|nr:hypothetical protein [Planctomycetota bacterium]
MIAYFASDLVWATRIKALAQDLSIEARPVRTVDMLAARLADSPVRGLIVDLEAPDTALALLNHLRAHHTAESPHKNPSVSRPVRTVAFGPHVETDALRQARAAGAQVVLTRGAFHHQLPDILHMLDAPSDSPAQ